MKKSLIALALLACASMAYAQPEPPDKPVARGIYEPMPLPLSSPIGVKVQPSTGIELVKFKKTKAPKAKKAKAPKTT